MDVLEELGEETLLALLHPQVIIDNGMTTPVLKSESVFMFVVIDLYSGIIPYYFGKMWTPTGYHLTDEVSMMSLYNGYITWLDGYERCVRRIDGSYRYSSGGRYGDDDFTFFTEDTSKLFRGCESDLFITSFGTFNTFTGAFYRGEILEKAKLRIEPCKETTYELVGTIDETQDLEIPILSNGKELLKCFYHHIKDTVTIDKKAIKEFIKLI